MLADQRQSNGLGWPHAAVLVAKMQFGLGVLGIPSTFRTLGILPGVVSLLLLSAITTYSGVLVTQIRFRHPEIHNVGDLGYVLLGTLGARLFGSLAAVFLLLVAGAGLLTMTIALNALTDHALCTVTFLGLAVVSIMLIGAPLRQLYRFSWLGWLGMVCAMSSVWILIFALLAQRRSSYTSDVALSNVTRPVVRKAVVGKADFVATMNAISIQTTALLGTVAFYPVSAEMHEPRLFTRAVLAGQAFVVANYLVVGLVVSLIAGQRLVSPALGSAGPVIEKVCFGFALPGLMVSTLLSSNITATYFFDQISHRCSTSVRRGRAAVRWSIWLSVYICVLLVGFVAAASIPLFDEFMGLIGAVAGPLFTMITPGLTELYLLSAEPKGGMTHSWRVWMTDAVRTMAKRRKAMLFGLPSIALVLIGMLLAVGGIYGSVRSIIQAYASDKVRTAFSCKDNSQSS